MKKIDVVILAGGYGERIKKYTKKKLPKSLLKIKNKNFLDYLILNLTKYNFNKIYIISGHKGNLIKKEYNNKYYNLVKIECINDNKKKGTGYALNFIKKKIKNNFILMNGDTLLDFNLNHFFLKKLKSNSLGSAVITKSYKKSLTKNLLNLDLDNKNMIKFSNKSNYISTGVIFFKKKVLNFINKKIFSLENDLIKKIILKKKIEGIKYSGFFIDIGTESNYLYAKNKIPKYFRHPAVFLDRDGVINKDIGHLHEIKKFKFTKKIIPFLKHYSNKNFFIFIVTNQGGIAKGYYGVKEFINLQMHIKKKLSEHNIFINDFEYCPHHPDGIVKKYKKICLCRKPNNLMIKRLFKKWNINKKKSLFIGDKNTDYLCAQKSKIKFIHYKNIYN